MFTEDYSVTSYLSSFKDHLFSLVSTTLKIVFGTNFFLDIVQTRGWGRGGLKYLRMSKLSTSKLGGAGGGGFNLLDNVPNLGVFFLKASLRKDLSSG